ncbi:hypothetical protein EU520_00685 [Candidatus Thorarchaeota archaeon]|nr:MAG: hypothetical protein EU520_00685 [Candidatus Thorarchaeota archaeon]
MRVANYNVRWGLKRKAVIMAVLLSVFLVMTTTPEAQAATYDAPETTAQIDVTIEDAYYLDLDPDLIENDVVVYVRFSLADFPYYEFAYIITLQLPSGTEYSYLVYVYAWIDDVYLCNVFFDHATESGNYTVYVEAVMFIPGVATDSGEYVFDPPGGSEGGKPTFGVY